MRNAQQIDWRTDIKILRSRLQSAGFAACRHRGAQHNDVQALRSACDALQDLTMESLHHKRFSTSQRVCSLLLSAAVCIAYAKVTARLCDAVLTFIATCMFNASWNALHTDDRRLLAAYHVCCLCLVLCLFCLPAAKVHGCVVGQTVSILHTRCVVGCSRLVQAGIGMLQPDVHHGASAAVRCSQTNVHAA